MNERADIEIRRAAAEQAALWMLTLKSEKLSPAQHAEFVEWLRESPLHVAEMLRICKLHRYLLGHKGWKQMTPVDLARSSGILHFQSLGVIPVGIPSRRRRSIGRRRPAYWVAAAIAVLGVVGVQTLARLNRSEFRTESGERRELTLPDGSVAQLSPDTDIVVRFGRHERTIELAHGTATFSVAKIPDRPFVVRAALTRIRALGTVFNVERDAEAVSVAVVEGRVAVSQQPPRHLLELARQPDVALVTLDADERVSITLAGLALPVRRLGSAVAASAQAGEITFENEPVSAVVRRFNLQNKLHIEILDSRLGERRVSGVFHGDDPQSFVDFIRATAGAQVVRPDSTHLILK